MNKGIINGKFSADGLKDVIEWIEMAETYKAEAPKKDPDASPLYWKYLKVDGLIEQLIENEDLNADWYSVYDEESNFDDLFLAALRHWGLDGRELEYRNELFYDGSEYWMEFWHIVLK